jgi:hypothetical protein
MAGVSYKKLGREGDGRHVGRASQQELGESARCSRTGSKTSRDLSR